MTSSSPIIKLVLAILGLLTASSAHALCVATTKNLLRIEVHACQQIVIDASSSRPPAHAIHRRGSSLKAVLITGTVFESETVWEEGSIEAEYVREAEIAPSGESGTFILIGDASKICPAMIGTEKTFVTEQPCCDVIPADGICLVPSPMTIIREEERPERWTEWKRDD